MCVALYLIANCATKNIILSIYSNGALMQTL